MNVFSAVLSEYLPFWKQLSDAQKAHLESVAVKRSFGKGDVLHRGSDDCIGLLLVLKGIIRVYTVSDEGKELTLYRLLERDVCLFSAACMLSEIQFDVFVSSEDETEVIVIPARAYKQLMENSLDVAVYTNRLMASRFSDVMWLVDQILNKKMDQRLAALLLEERSLRESDELATTHEELANHLGTVREVVTRMLKYLQEEKLVVLRRGSVTLTDAGGLEKFAGSSMR
ncbi:MAG TPA: Crp/Fnr family transcriptional regulator [Bacillota bacterium]|nr:Crp/Fnr family transcriptional regulator [Bacillota bacterium]